MTDKQKQNQNWRRFLPYGITALIIACYLIFTWALGNTEALVIAIVGVVIVLGIGLAAAMFMGKKRERSK